MKKGIQYFLIGVIPFFACTSEHLTNLAPTFLDFAGIDIPDDVQGVSFRPLLNGNVPDDWRKSVYYRYYDSFFGIPQYGVRTEKYKLIYFPTIDKYELFDLKSDPKETKNVFGVKKYSDVVDQMKTELRMIKEKYKDFE